MNTKRFLYLFLIIFFITFAEHLSAQPGKWKTTGIGGGGALFSPAISPFQSSEIFIACDMTELFYTSNSGLTWEVIPFYEIRAIPETMVQFTNDPNILYAINGDFLADQKKPVKSTDGGHTWTELQTDPTFGETYYLFADDNSTSRLIVTNYDNIFFSNDGGNTFKSIYNNSEDDGAYVGSVFWDGSNIFIGTSRGVLVSTNNGDTFSMASLSGIPASEGIVSFAGAKQNGITRFFCITLGYQDIWPTVTGAEHWGYMGIYTIDYGSSSSWTLRTTGISDDDHPFFVATAKNNIDIAYVAGGNASTSYPIIFKTTDAGNFWQSAFQTTNNQNIITGWSGYRGDEDWWYGEFALGFAVAPHNPDIAVITDLGFAHITTDGGSSWKQMYVSPSDQNPANAPTPKGKSYKGIGLENTSCWWVTWSDPDNIFAAFTDFTAIRSTDGGNSWSKDYSGIDFNSVYFVIKHPTTGLLYAASSSIHDIYESTYLQNSDIDYGTGQILYSTDKGKTWLTLHDFGHPVIWLSLDHNNSMRMYASVIHSTEGGIYVSNDIQNGASSSWTKLADPPRTEGHPFNIHVLNDGTLVCTYSGRREENGVFANSSGVFLSTENGSSWFDRSDPGMLYWTRDIVVDPHDASQNTWYVSVFSGWGGPPNGLGGLYKTTDRGISWVRINDLERVASCTICPVNTNEMYVTTEAEGLWFTDNLSANTPTFSLVNSYLFQHPQRVFYNPYNPDEIWVTSFGNGIRVGSTSSTVVDHEKTELPTEFKFDIYPNPVKESFNIRIRLDRTQKLTITIYNILGQRIAAVADQQSFTKGQHHLKFETGSLQTGLYYVSIAAKSRRIVKKLIYVK
jgi:photosystem II stability/assembly factor-like uncharacterized protein